MTTWSSSSGQSLMAGRTSPVTAVDVPHSSRVARAVSPAILQPCRRVAMLNENPVSADRQTDGRVLVAMHLIPIACRACNCNFLRTPHGLVWSVGDYCLTCHYTPMRCHDRKFLADNTGTDPVSCHMLLVLRLQR